VILTAETKVLKEEKNLRQNIAILTMELTKMCWAFRGSTTYIKPDDWYLLKHWNPNN